MIETYEIERWYETQLDVVYNEKHKKRIRLISEALQRWNLALDQVKIVVHSTNGWKSQQERTHLEKWAEPIGCGQELMRPKYYYLVPTEAPRL